MNLKALLTRFKSDEDGAVTVDWVVLAAGIVGLAVVIGGTVTQGVQNAATEIESEITTNNSMWTVPAAQ